MASRTVAEPDLRQASIDYQLGELLIRVGTAQVVRGGQEIPLPRLSFDLLLALVQAAPNVVTVDELMDRVWPGVVVSPETVSQRVKLLRAALNDPSQAPRYIAGVRGRGYRIVAPVTSHVAGVDIPPVPARRKTRAHTVLWVGIPALALMLAVIIPLRIGQKEHELIAPLPPRSVAVLPFDNLGRTPQDAALAFGLPETLLHRLAGFNDLTVIARGSSFSASAGNMDIREIGRKLNVRYVVEGSLQSDAKHLRITAQLIDASDGSHVWSMQFDREPRDIFAIQDEIANKMAQALQITVAGMRGKDTRNFDAYLAYSQGRKRLATWQVSELKLALADFERALRFDPDFADAYASLARTHLVLAAQEVTEQRRANIEKATVIARQLLAQALQLDPANAEAHFELGALIDDPARAEAEIRRGLAANPNSATGYQRLAALLWQQGKRNDALVALDRVRELDPMDLANDVWKAAWLLYTRSDLQQAEELSLEVLKRDPSSSGALTHLGEISWCCRSQYARGARYLEQALQADPNWEFARRMLMRAYLDMGDVVEARAVAAAAAPIEARMLSVMLYEHDWEGAGKLVYDEVQRGTAEPIDAPMCGFAVRMHARLTGDYDSARKYLEHQSGVRWDADGVPHLQPYEPYFTVPLAGVLVDIGQKDQAIQLLRATLSSFDYEAHQLGRGEMWYLIPTAQALALLGRDDEALATLEQAIDNGGARESWLWLDAEPTYDQYRHLPRFKALTDKAHRIAAEQRRELDQMRKAQQIAWRTRFPGHTRTARLPRT